MSATSYRSVSTYLLFVSKFFSWFYSKIPFWFQLTCWDFANNTKPCIKKLIRALIWNILRGLLSCKVSYKDHWIGNIIERTLSHITYELEHEILLVSNEKYVFAIYKTNVIILINVISL